MASAKHLLPMVPTGLTVLRVRPGCDKISILTAPAGAASSCPVCGRTSRRVHSRYTRSFADLPWQGLMVVIAVLTRRFRCATDRCPRRIFTERLPGIVGVGARRTFRLGDVQRHVGLALGGRAGARLAARLAMPLSGDTLLRMVRSGHDRAPVAPRVLGVDDWAWRRGQRYGTILRDLERRQVIDLLPDRQADSFARWLTERPEVEIISRDRGATYADGARRGAPGAVQVADRWHLLENCSRAFLAVIERRQRRLREAARVEAPAATSGSAVAGPPPPMTSAERLKWERWRRERLLYDRALRLAADGMPIKEIARTLKLARSTVRRWLRGGEPELHRPRRSSLDPHRAFLERRWREGCRNGAQLWRELRATGFEGSLRVVAEWAARHRLTARAGRIASGFTALSCRQVDRLLRTDVEDLTNPQCAYIERVLAIAPEIATARALAGRFADMVRQRLADDLDGWLDDAENSELRSFAAGLRQDNAAVRAALTTPWSNGQTEGQITKLKLLKRQMYGRAKLDLLRARLVQAA